MSTRNFEEYRAEVLEGLGATTEDIRNEASWRAKVLEALGAEYTDEDTRNFERYRLKVLENLSGGGGGGGSSDFSTAKVTVVSTNGRIISAGHIVTEDGDDYLTYGITEAGEYDVITYKGSALLMAAIEAGETITVSGDAETSGSEIYVTGDCTITIS